MNKTLFLVRGLPGSGKSTLARRLTQDVFEADQYFEQGGVYNFDGRLLHRAHMWCREEVTEFMHIHGKACAVANTFTQQWEMEPYRALAAQFGYRVVEITVKTDLTDAELAARNLHGVPEASIARMRARWEA